MHNNEKQSVTAYMWILKIPNKEFQETAPPEILII